MKYKIFQFILVHCPKEDKAKEKFVPSIDGLIFNFVLAKDDAEARMKAARLIPAEYVEDLDQLEIVMRPF